MKIHCPVEVEYVAVTPTLDCQEAEVALRVRVPVNPVTAMSLLEKPFELTPLMNSKTDGAPGDGYMLNEPAPV